MQLIRSPVEKKGAWLQFDGALFGQGRDAAKKALVEKPELAKKIVEAIHAQRDVKRVPGAQERRAVSLLLAARSPLPRGERVGVRGNGSSK